MNRLIRKITNEYKYGVVFYKKTGVLLRSDSSALVLLSAADRKLSRVKWTGISGVPVGVNVFVLVYSAYCPVHAGIFSGILVV